MLKIALVIYSMFDIELFRIIIVSEFDFIYLFIRLSRIKQRHSDRRRLSVFTLEMK